jgi:hypothetical protein
LSKYLLLSRNKEKLEENLNLKFVPKAMIRKSRKSHLFCDKQRILAPFWLEYHPVISLKGTLCLQAKLRQEMGANRAIKKMSNPRINGEILPQQ